MTYAPATWTGGPVVELVGPAGAGKSSMFRALEARVAPAPLRADVRVTGCLPAALGLLPTFVRWHQPYRRLLHKEIKRALFLAALAQSVSRTRQRRPGGIVFDEGPVYMLSRLLYFGAWDIDGEAFRQWWTRTIRQWAATLQLIVWLDAETTVLARRVRGRPGPPPLRASGEAAFSEFVGRYRDCYRMVLDDLGRAGGPPVLSLDTTHEDFDSLVGRVHAAIEARGAGD